MEDHVRQADNRPPVLPWSLPAFSGTVADRVDQAYAPGIDYCLRTDFPYHLAVFHSRPIHRIDRNARRIALLMEACPAKHGTGTHCDHFLGHILNNRTLARDDP